MLKGTIKVESLVDEVSYNEWSNYGKHRVYFTTPRKMINGYIDLDTMESTNLSKSWYLFDEVVELIKKELENIK